MITPLAQQHVSQSLLSITGLSNYDCFCGFRFLLIQFYQVSSWLTSVPRWSPPQTSQEPETLNLPPRQAEGCGNTSTTQQTLYPQWKILFVVEKTDMRHLFTGLSKPVIMSIKHLTTFLNCVFDILFLLVFVFHFKLIGLKIFQLPLLKKISLLISYVILMQYLSATKVLVFC